MEKNENLKKELFFYLGILAILIIIIVCNNVFWKFGKKQDNYNIKSNITHFISDNIIYNVQFEEQWLE